MDDDSGDGGDFGCDGDGCDPSSGVGPLTLTHIHDNLLSNLLSIHTGNHSVMEPS